MKRLYFIRHGETEWNRLRRIQGQADIPLNEKGRREAAAAALSFAPVNFDVCYCSPLCRAEETARILLRNKFCEIKTEPLLLEIAYGIDEGQSLDLIAEDKTLPLHKFFSAPEKYVPPAGAESIPQLCERCGEFLRKMSNEKGENILAVCHGSFIRGIISVVCNLPQKDFWTGKEQKNCAATIVKWEKGKWNLEAEAVAAWSCGKF